MTEDRRAIVVQELAKALAAAWRTSRESAADEDTDREHRADSVPHSDQEDQEDAPVVVAMFPLNEKRR
jgi:hypothetical protein